MYNFLKSIFGVPSIDQPESRIESELPNEGRDVFTAENHINDDIWNDDHNMKFHSEGSINNFGFPVFSDAIEIHKFFENFVEEMHRKFEMLDGFHNGNILNWDEDISQSGSEEFTKKPESLRESFLKTPGYISDKNAKKEDIDLDGQIKVNEVEHFLRKSQGTSERSSQSMVPYTSPKVYSKSVYIRTFKRPDGTVETIKKVRDHTGKEETIVTVDNPNPPYDPNVPIQPSDHQVTANEDIPGISIFKKFFPF